MGKHQAHSIKKKIKGQIKQLNQSFRTFFPLDFNLFVELSWSHSLRVLLETLIINLKRRNAFLTLKINPVPVTKPAMHINMCECPRGLKFQLEKKKKKTVARLKQDDRSMRILRILILPE